MYSDGDGQVTAGTCLLESRMLISPNNYPTLPLWWETRIRSSSGSHLSPSSTISIGLCDCFIPIKENDSYTGRNESECEPIKCLPLFRVLWAKGVQAPSTGGSMSQSKEEGHGMDMVAGDVHSAGSSGHRAHMGPEAVSPTSSPGEQGVWEADLHFSWALGETMTWEPLLILT